MKIECATEICTGTGLDALARHCLRLKLHTHAS
jgi:hypothetical protein